MRRIISLHFSGEVVLMIVRLSVRFYGVPNNGTINPVKGAKGKLG
jgi:hypothetical protein